MNIQKIDCVSCGAPVQISPDLDQFNCVFCGTGLQVQRTEGSITLKLAGQVSQAIQDSGALTRLELKRLQLSNLQAEIRTVGRLPRSRLTVQQYKDLQKQEKELRAQIEPPIDAASKQVNIRPPTPPLKVARGCLVGFLVFCVIGITCSLIAIPLDEVFFKPPVGSIGPIYRVAGIFSFFFALAISLYTLNPQAPFWKALKDWLTEPPPAKKRPI